ncbi:hypothetical protein ABPG72_011404 [Tetrahymena utriculariae]
MASIDKIKSCIIQENEEFEKIEQDLKDLIDSQLSKKEEYTSILSYMMQQYELVSQLDINLPTFLKQSIFDILNIVNLLPQKQFNVKSEIDTFSFDNINHFKKKVEEQEGMIKKNKKIVENIVEQLHFCNEQLTKKMNSKDWYLDDFQVNQQKLLLSTQMAQTEFLRDVNYNAFQLKSLITQNILRFGQINFKNYNEFIYTLLLKDDNFLTSGLRKSSDYLSIQINGQFKYQVERVKNGVLPVSCFFNYILKPQKKYIFRINLYSSNKLSKFYVGLLRQDEDLFNLNYTDLGIIIDSNKNNVCLQQTGNNQSQNQKKRIQNLQLFTQQIGQSLLLSKPAQQLIKIENKYPSTQKRLFFDRDQNQQQSLNNLQQQSQLEAQVLSSNPESPKAKSIDISSNIYEQQNSNLNQNQQEQPINTQTQQSQIVEQNIFQLQPKAESQSLLSYIKGQLIPNLNQKIISINISPQQSQKVSQDLFTKQAQSQLATIFISSQQQQPTNINQNPEESKNMPQQQAQKVEQNFSSTPVQLKAEFTNKFSDNQRPIFQNKSLEESLNKFLALTSQSEDKKLCYYDIQPLEFRVCLQDQLIQYSFNSNKYQQYLFATKNVNQTDKLYHFGFEFCSDHVSDKIEIIDFQELDEFPKI